MAKGLLPKGVALGLSQAFKKKHKYVNYKLQQEFFQKYFVVHECSAVKNPYAMIRTVFFIESVLSL